ncbi:RNA recognition motif domain [Macleaya cordata]|uniref:RNA recognition motif domain n=1 Tax=Macleaya cordata TaxID=56857 RepID=A0A200PXF1_MACCD|nr:RNA recognition motif domain [Macleaya cordata]
MPANINSNEEEEAGGGSTDIFKALFGRDSTEEVGLGFRLDSKTENGETNLDQSEVKKKKTKKKKREKGTKPDSDVEKLESDSEKLVEAKKRKREREKSPNLVVGSIGTDEGKKRKKYIEKEIGSLNLDVVSIGNDEVKKRKKEKEEKPNLNVVSIENNSKKLVKKKKRKRDEIEEQYEARIYGVDEKIEGKGEDVKSKKVGEKRKSMDDPAEMMVSKEGFDDESKLLRTVFVGNLPLKTKKKALLKEFSRFGEVESVRIRSVPILDGKIPRKGAIIKGKINDTIDSVHAYIVFKEEKSAQDSLSHNMAMVGGNHIRVDMACPPRKKLKGENTPLYDHKRTVFVGNLPFDVKDEELYQLFCGINQLESSIEAVRVIRDPHTSVGKGIAYVLFKTREAAHLLVKKKYLKLRDRDLRFYHAKSDSTLPKKRDLPLGSANHTPTKRLARSPSGDHLDRNKPMAKANLSYQGLRASKSGVQKKEGSRPRIGDRGIQQFRTEGGGPERKVRNGKRPAVAARKAKALKSLGTPKQTGIKRKMENRTPDNSNRNKKPRKFR